MEYIALAVAPGIAICMYFFYKDVYNREPKFNLFISFLFGCAAVLPPLFIEGAFNSVIDGTVAGVAIFSFFVVACSEEISKFIGLRFYSYNQKSFDEPLDGIVYSVMVSMGFATVENIKYVLEFAAKGQGLQVGLARMFLSVPAHATFAVIMGYYVGRAKFSPARSLSLMVLGLTGAILFHGTFDFFVFINKLSYVGQQTGNELLFFGAVVSFIVSIVLSRKLIRRQRNISQEMFKEQNKTTSV